jgi:hypothetical protein
VRLVDPGGWCGRCGGGGGRVLSRSLAWRHLSAGESIGGSDHIEYVCQRESSTPETGEPHSTSASRNEPSSRCGTFLQLPISAFAVACACAIPLLSPSAPPPVPDPNPLRMTSWRRPGQGP